MDLQTANQSISDITKDSMAFVSCLSLYSVYCSNNMLYEKRSNSDSHTRKEKKRAHLCIVNILYMYCEECIHVCTYLVQKLEFQLLFQYLHQSSFFSHIFLSSLLACIFWTICWTNIITIREVHNDCTVSHHHLIKYSHRLLYTVQCTVLLYIFFPLGK